MESDRRPRRSKCDKWLAQRAIAACWLEEKSYKWSAQFCLFQCWDFAINWRHGIIKASLLKETHISIKKKQTHTHTLLSGAIRWSVWVKTSSFKWINGKSIAHNTTWSTQWSCHRLRRLMSQRCLAFIELKREHLEDFMERLWDVGTGKDGDITNTPRCLLEKWSREWIIIISPSWNEVILGWFLWRKPSFTVTLASEVTRI